MSTEEHIRINRLFCKLTSLRAENLDIDDLEKAYTEIESLSEYLKNLDHQIIFGRRGTGKTHALRYLFTLQMKQNSLPIYLDLRLLGSSAGLYSDEQLPISERASRLLVDVMEQIHTAFYSYFVDNSEDIDLSQTGPLLDRLAEEITHIRIKGPMEKESFSEELSALNSSKTIEINQTNGLSFSASNQNNFENKASLRSKESGTQIHSIHFGIVSSILQKIVNLLKPHRVWILLDEWSSIPTALQPYLAEMLRRLFLPLSNVTIKIAAIECRSNLRIRIDTGNYIGIEQGADIPTILNIDDYLVFENDPEQTISFYKNLLFNRLTQVIKCNSDFSSTAFHTSDDIIKHGFTNIHSFEELIKSAEGVPRDFINILAKASQYTRNTPISVTDVRKSAREWFINSKRAAIDSYGKTNAFLGWIIAKVLSEHRIRNFLIEVEANYPLIKELFDARIIHMYYRGISIKTHPSIRFNAYRVDYGCFIEFFSTNTICSKGSQSSRLLKEEIRLPVEREKATNDVVINCALFEEFYVLKQKAMINKK